MMSFFKSPSGIVALGFLAFGGYFLITEHAAHTIAWLPWLILLACPLMHVFMHRGHGGHANHTSHSFSEDKEVSNSSVSQIDQLKDGGNNE